MKPLQRRPNQKAPELAEELGVSVRTLHRYIAMLDEMGIPVYSERGPHGGFSLVRGYKMPPLVFTPEEAVAVYLGTGLGQPRLLESAGGTAGRFGDRHLHRARPGVADQPGAELRSLRRGTGAGAASPARE